MKMIEIENFYTFLTIQRVKKLSMNYTLWIGGLVIINNTITTILIMMLRSSNPIIFRCGPLIEFSNESSVKVLYIQF